ncbi:collagen-like protein [Phocaeicola dorei]|uniref:collagen-like protein n=1 Tax=Phocaeicola dorei TaxID=357276 RepID=UPI0032EAF82E
MRNGKSGTGYMELNTINKTGTWSETADRINSNFSKISIEVEEIKQNGGGGSGGGGGDVTNADHATSAYTLDKNTPVLDWFLSALNDDDAQGIINYLKGLKIAGNLINRIVKQGDKDVTYTDEDVMSALRVMTEIENSAEKLKEIFVRKDVADSTKFLLSMFAGAVFGKNGFASGLTGFGAKIFDTGHGEFESMFIRRFLEVPELRYNRVMVTLGDKWRAPGAGIIETVDTGTKTCTLKLEDGEIGAVAVGDICMGIYHNITGNATEDYDDGKGNRRFAGFCTVYFTITEVTGERNETFKYQLRPTSSSWSSSFDPFEMMTFVAYGSFTNTERQTSVYETRTYTRMLWKQNTWEISAANVALQYGDLSNLNIFGLNMDGYSMYLNNIYMTGIIKQIKPDGTPVQTLNFREEGYIPGVHYDYYDSLSYNGSMWACINEDGSSSVPGSNGDWLEIASKGDTGTPGKDGVSVTNSGPWYSGLVVPKMSIVTMGGSSFLSKASTTNPPLWCWTDNAGNRFTFNAGGYCLTGEMNTAEYELLVESGKDGSDGIDYERIFVHTTTENKPATPSTSQTDDYIPSGWHDDPLGVSESLPFEWISERKKKDGIWSDFSDPALWAKYGFDGLGIDNADVMYAISDSNTTAPTTGWQTDPPAWQNGKYIWTKTLTTYSDGTTSETDPVCISGGKGIKTIVEYYYRSTSNTTQTGGSWVTSYPGWQNGTYIWTKSLITYTDGTTEETPPVCVTGSKGEGYTQMGQFKTGMVVPKMGVVSMGGGSYVAKASTTNPPLWCWTDNAGNRFTFNDGGYVLTGEVNTAEYDVWAEKGDTGEKGDKGDDGEKGDKGDKGDQGVQGIQGCIIRDSEWTTGVTYRNDEALTSGTRYIDIVMVRNNSAVDGWDVYKCIKTHTSSSSITYTNTTYWTELSNVGPIYTSLIIAKNASLDFVQGNELIIKDSNNNVVAGLTGGSSKEAGTTPVRIWAGGGVPGSAPYRVNELGEFVSTKANVTGIITATLFYSPGSDMDSLADSEGNMTVNPSTQGSTFFSADGLGGTITLPPASSWNGLKLEFVVDMTSRVAKNPDKYKATNYFCGLAGSYNNKTEIQMARPYVLEMKAFNNHWYITRMDLIE